MGKSFSPGFVEQGYSCKAYLIFVGIFVDCVISGWTDHIWAQSSMPIEIVLVVVSIGIQLLLLLVFFTTLWRTFLMRTGMLELACYEFRNPFLFIFLRLGLL